MPDQPDPALTQLAAEVIAAVERLLREGKSGRVEVNVNPHVSRRRRIGEVKCYVKVPEESYS